jgi:hypothetical protein
MTTAALRPQSSFDHICGIDQTQRLLSSNHAAYAGPKANIMALVDVEGEHIRAKAPCMEMVDRPAGG